MFTRAFRIKSNTTIKGSDKRKLRVSVTAAFPGLGQIPGRRELNILRLCTYRGDTVTVYVSGRNPILFEVEKNLYPTIYTLWAYPDLLPVFTTWLPVLKKLVGGADLMLPGLLVPPAGLPLVKPGDLCAITLVGSRVPVAIGIASMSTDEMLACDLKGKGFTVLHTYLDYLWRSGDKSPLPYIAPLDQPPSEHSGSPKDVQGGPVVWGDMQGDKEIREAPESPLAEDQENFIVAELGQHIAYNKTLAEQMDELLEECFFHALKSRVTKADLPLLTSTFLGRYMFSCCPKGQQLDVKKSSYKKLSKFLNCMMKQEILQVKELSKGVESIVAVDWKHPSITSFIVPESSSTIPIQKITKTQCYRAPEIKHLYRIPANMTALFREAGHKKGSTLSVSEVRKIIMDYAQKNKLLDADNKDSVKLDPTLSDCLLEKTEQYVLVNLSWDDLFARCLGKLQPAYEVTFHGQEPIVKKGKIYPIDIILAHRSFNRKVTLIRNLEFYGLDPYSVATILQQRVQASATVSPVPGTRNAVQVQIQGNHMSQLNQLLFEEYRIPEKYIHGLEKAGKADKK